MSPVTWGWAASPRRGGTPLHRCCAACEAGLEFQLQTRQELVSPEDDETVLPLLSSGRLEVWRVP